MAGISHPNTQVTPKSHPSQTYKFATLPFPVFALCSLAALHSAQFAIGRLGIFHFIKRITDRLRKLHKRFGDAQRSLSSKIFQVDQDHVRQVELALRDGLLGGKTHSPEEIAQLHTSGVFMRRYRKYIESSVSLNFFSETDARATLIACVRIISRVNRTSTYDTPFENA